MKVIVQLCDPSSPKLVSTPHRRACAGMSSCGRKPVSMPGMLHSRNSTRTPKKSAVGRDGHALDGPKSRSPCCEGRILMEAPRVFAARPWRDEDGTALHRFRGQLLTACQDTRLLLLCVCGHLPAPERLSAVPYQHRSCQNKQQDRTQK